MSETRYQEILDRLRNNPNQTTLSLNDGVMLFEMLTPLEQVSFAKETLLCVQQLSDTAGVRAATVFTFDTQPDAGYTLVLTNEAVTKTIVAGPSGGDVNFVIGADVATTLTNLASAIDSLTDWGAVYYASLTSIHTNGVVVIYEKVAQATNSRLYAAPYYMSGAKFIDYSVYLDYASLSLIQVPREDPNKGNFGIRRAITDVKPDEEHILLTNDMVYTWEVDSGHWIGTGGGALPVATAASGGGTQGIVTFDSDKGLGVTAGVAEVKLGSGLAFAAGVITPATATAGAGGGTKGILSADSAKGLNIAAGVAEVKLGTGMAFDGSGNITTSADADIAIPILGSMPGSYYSVFDFQDVWTIEEVTIKVVGAFNAGSTIRAIIDGATPLVLVETTDGVDLTQVETYHFFIDKKLVAANYGRFRVILAGSTSGSATVTLSYSKPSEAHTHV